MSRYDIIALCIFCVLWSRGHAQTTEIDVHYGVVRAELNNMQLDIEAGRKAVLQADGRTNLSISNPLVDEALTLVKLIQREQEQGELKIESVLAMAIDMTISDNESSTAAIYAEFPNPYKIKTEALTMGPIVRVDNFQIYDADGNRLQVDVRPTGDPDHAYYIIHFKTAYDANALMQFVVVATLDKIPYRPGGSDGVWKSGPLWHFFMELNMVNSLHYYRVILPDSAIYVDSTIQAIATATHNERTAVTLRQYTGPYDDSKFTLAFLYPNHDNTTLADLPSSYLGHLSKTERDTRSQYQQERNMILSGKRYQDQSTPIAAFLSLCSAAHHDDLPGYGKTKEVVRPGDKKQAKLEGVRYWIDIFTGISTQPWPKNPGNGYIHPLYLRRTGTELPEIKQPMIFRDQQWYARPSINYISNMAQEGSSEQMGDEAVASLQTAGFITDWEVVGPYAQADTQASHLFDIPFGPEVGGRDVPWRKIPIEIVTFYGQDYAHVNLHKYLDGGPSRVAYLRSTINAGRKHVKRLDLRSDDGVKVWLNGQLIHANNIARGIDIGPDTVQVELRKGKNELLVKVIQDFWDWGLIAQLGSNKAVAPTPTGRTWNPNIPVVLKWTPATDVQSHRIYLGTHREALPLLDEVTAVDALPPLSLEPGKHYYWRVDEVLAEGRIVKGDIWDFATGKQVAWWPLDRNLNNHISDSLHGSTQGNLTWDKGVQHQALVLKEDNDFVTIPPMHLDTDTLTVTMWVKTSAITENPGLFFTRDASTCAGLWLGGRNDLRYCWNDDPATWSWDSGLTVPHRKWTFLAMVVDLFRAKLYLHDGQQMQTSQHDYGHGSAQFDGDTWIGHDPRWSTFEGAIDDVRLFSYALQPGEIEALYQQTAPTR